MFQHEIEYRSKERRLKRLIRLLGVVCVISLAVNISNTVHAERLRQTYIYSVWWNLQSLETFMFNLQFDIEQGKNIIDTDSIWRGAGFAQSVASIERELSNLAAHRGFRSEHIPQFFRLDRHVFDLAHQMNEGGEEEREAAIDFLSRRREEIAAILDELTIVSYGQRNSSDGQSGEAQLHSANTRISTRRLFRLLNTFTDSVREEAWASW